MNGMRAGGFIFVVVALSGAVFSFLQLSGAALPYQDATQAMLEKQSGSVRFWAASLVVCLFCFIGGGWRLWRSRHKK